MWHILKKSLLILAIIVIADQAFSYVFIHAFFLKTISGESGGTINYVIEKNPHPDFLILGASRAKEQIDPSLLTSLGTNGYNLGINGNTVLASSLILDILLRNGVKPKTLVLQTDSSDYVVGVDQNIKDQVDRVYPYDTPLIRSYVAQLGPVEQIKYFFGLYRLNRKTLDISYNFLKRNSIGTTTGFTGLSNTATAPDGTSIATNYIYQSTSTSIEAIKRIADACKQNNIRLIVVFAPSYNNAMRNDTAQKDLVTDLKKYNIDNIIDLSDIASTPDLAGAENWRDAIHMNNVGAEKFSRDLNKAISRLTLTNTLK